MGKLGDICTNQSSNIKQGDLETLNGKYPIYGAGGFIKNVDFYKQEKPYVAVVKDGAGIGRVMQLPAFSSVIGTMQYIIPNEGTDAKYLAFAMEHMNLSKYFTGATIPHIYFKDYKNEHIKDHDYETQKRIAANLDKVTNLIDTCNAILEKLDLLVKSRFVEMFGDVILNPLNWDTLTLNDICVKITDGEHGSVERSEEGYPFLNAKHITKSGDIDWNTVTYVSENIHKKIYARCNPCYDDILMTTTGTIGNMTIVPNCGEFSMDRGITLLKLNHDKVCSAFVYCYLQSKSIQDIMVSNVHASAIGHLFINQVMRIPMYLPPLALQQQFAAFVAQTDKSKVAVQNVLEKAEILKKALMQEYFG